MRRTSFIISISALIFVSAGLLPAEEELPVAVLEYFDDPWEVVIYDFTGQEIEDFDFGTKILIGFGIQTYDSYAELRLEPNGSILNLNPHTFIKFKELQGVSGTRQNSIAQVTGKMRVVAARVQGENYSVQTPSIAMGVRGTDFLIEIDEEGGASVAVNEGLVDLFNPYTGSTMEIEGGEIANAKENVMTIMEEEAKAVKRKMDDFRFNSLDPVKVPRFDIEKEYNDFEYFKELEQEAYKAYFSREDFFDDYQEYMEKFRDYYSQEMEDFHRILEEEERRLEEIRRGEEEAVREAIQEAEDAHRNEMDAFQEYLKKQSN